MLTRETIIDTITVLDYGAIQVRQATYILDEGQRIAGPMYHRRAYEPGTDISTENTRVQDISAVVWTPEVVQAHRDRLAADDVRRR